MKITANLKATLLTLAIAPQISGCASLISDNTYDVSIVSQPVKASYTITNKRGELVAEGVTPANVALDSFSGFFRAARYDVIYSHSEFPDKSVSVKATLSPFYFFNYPFGAFIGFLIDPFTGAMFNLPSEVRSDLSLAETGKLEP